MSPATHPDGCSKFNTMRPTNEEEFDTLYYKIISNTYNDNSNKTFLINYSFNLSKCVAKILFINARYFDMVPFISVKRRQTHNNNNEKNTVAFFLELRVVTGVPTTIIIIHGTTN